jgi:predicted glycoside hydrolase/deacetylase ChbG (UPF0249 family)
MGTRLLVVNADDFGRTAGVNRGIARAHKEGIVTEATLMVRWPAAEAAGQYARAHPELGVGLHLDLSEWEYVDDEWRPTYQVVDLENCAAVEAEADRQLGCFLRLVGRPPSHLDSHQHVHREEPVRSVLGKMGAALGVPVRELTPGVTYRGDFYGQDARGWPVPEAITVEALLQILRDLPEGITELGCHPADPSDLESVYRDERAVELEALCDPRVAQVLVEEGIALRSFATIQIPDRNAL